MTIGDPKPNMPKELRINVSRLALQTGYSPSHISRVISCKTVPSLKCLTTMGEALKVDITDLYDLIWKGAINAREQTGTGGVHNPRLGP